jgi:phage major head subunit gpT-like protein
MATESTNFSELLEPGLRRIYGDSYKEYPEEYSKIFSVETSTRAWEESLSMAGLGLVPTKPEGQGITYDDPIQGPTHQITHSTYGKGFIVTREMFEDDLYKKIRNLPKALARSVRMTIETTAANVYNNAFDATVATGADGKELCATDHVLLAGGSYKNELTTAADFDTTSLEQALIDIANMVDDRGLLIHARPVKLVHPTELDWQVKKVLQSEKDPDSANNAINPAVGSFSGGIILNHYLTDPDAWFIITDVPNGPVFYWRRRPAFSKDNDFDTENAKWKTTYRMSVGWDDPRGLFGSPGV